VTHAANPQALGSESIADVGPDACRLGQILREGYQYVLYKAGQNKVNGLGLQMKRLG